MTPGQENMFTTEPCEANETTDINQVGAVVFGLGFLCPILWNLRKDYVNKKQAEL